MESTHSIDKTRSIGDDREHLLSCMEAESLMGEEKQWTSPEIETGRRSNRNKFTNTFRSYWRLLDTFLVLVIILLLIMLRDQWKRSPSALWQVGGDFTGAGPKCLSCCNIRQYTKH